MLVAKPVKRTEVGGNDSFLCADVYYSLASKLPASQQWKLRQVCAAWRQHYDNQPHPPHLTLVITQQWRLAATPRTLLPLVLSRKRQCLTLQGLQKSEQCFLQ